jgi:hypothetical protein
VVAALPPEEGGWICIVLLHDGHVLRLDAMQGERRDIRAQRAATTIDYW